MNNSKLNELLRRAAVPARTEAEWQELAGDTMRSLAASRENAVFARGAARRPHRTPWLLGLGLAAACVLAGFFLGHWRSELQAQRAELADARKLFAEISMMFPDQLQAVVLDGAAPRLVLADKISGDQGPPLYVRLCGAQGCQRVITYSGQRVSLNGESCEVLLDARGRIIVSGERFAWSSGQTTLAGGYRIEAATLAGTL